MRQGPESADAALEHLERALVLIERRLDGEHPDAAGTTGNLAMIYQRTDQEKAKELFQESLEMRRRGLDPDHPDIAAGILESQAAHIRLQHFSLEKARALWDKMGEHEVWK